MAGFIGINLLTANSGGTPGGGTASYGDNQLQTFQEKRKISVREEEIYWE